jgi:hypothetical protein
MTSNKFSSLLKYICCCFYHQSEDDNSRQKEQKSNGFENPLYSETSGDDLLYRLPTINFVNPLFDQNFKIEQDSEYEHDISFEHNKNPMDPTSSNHDEWFNIQSESEDESKDEPRNEPN